MRPANRCTLCCTQFKAKIHESLAASKIYLSIVGVRLLLRKGCFVRRSVDDRYSVSMWRCAGDTVDCLDVGGLSEMRLQTWANKIKCQG